MQPEKTFHTLKKLLTQEKWCWNTTKRAWITMTKAEIYMLRALSLSSAHPAVTWLPLFWEGKTKDCKRGSCRSEARGNRESGLDALFPTARTRWHASHRPTCHINSSKRHLISGKWEGGWGLGWPVYQTGLKQSSISYRLPNSHQASRVTFSKPSIDQGAIQDLSSCITMHWKNEEITQTCTRKILWIYLVS